MLLIIVPCLAHGAVVYLFSAFAGKPWFETLAHLVQDPVEKIEWLDAMFDWDTLIEGKFRTLRSYDTYPHGFF